MSKLDHPCKSTCSGWKQGYDEGKKESEEKLEEACKYYAAYDNDDPDDYYNNLLMNFFPEIEELKDIHSFDQNPMITYNSEIDEDILRVLELSESDKEFYSTDIAKKLNLPEKYVELIKTILSYGDMLDYGTSPRGGWITDKGKEFAKTFRENTKK